MLYKRGFIKWVSQRRSCWYSDHLNRVIHKSLRDFRPLRYSSRDGHAEGEHVKRGRDTPSLCPTLQVLDMSTLLCLSWLLRTRVWEFRMDLWIALYLSGVDYTERNSIWSLQDFSSGQGMVRLFFVTVRNCWHTDEVKGVQRIAMQETRWLSFMLVKRRASSRVMPRLANMINEWHLPQLDIQF